MEEKKLKRLKRHLEKQLIDCMELEKKNDLTKEGRGMLLELRAIFEYMGWKEPEIRKMCKMTSEEKKTWEKEYYDLVKRGVHENKIHSMIQDILKERFPRLRDFEVLY